MFSVPHPITHKEDPATGTLAARKARTDPRNGRLRYRCCTARTGRFVFLESLAVHAAIRRQSSGPTIFSENQSRTLSPAGSIRCRP